MNPRVFPAFRNDRAWITRGVLGERMFMNRKEVPIPGDHVRIAHLLIALAFIAMIGAIVGFVTKQFWLALGGWLLCHFQDVVCRSYGVDIRNHEEHNARMQGLESKRFTCNSRVACITQPPRRCTGRQFRCAPLQVGYTGRR